MTRRSLTSHQREVWHRLRRWTNRTPSGWVHSSILGSVGALDHLVDKGYAERDSYSGPRGGEHHRYRAIEQTSE
jgi:hypothetical protein